MTWIIITLMKETLQHELMEAFLEMILDMGVLFWPQLVVSPDERFLVAIEILHPL